MKNKKIVLVIIVSIFCILMGISSVKAERQSKTLLPNQYWGLGKYMQTGETLNFRIESDPKSINIYIMNDAQIISYQDNPQDFASDYIRQWTSYTLFTYSFVALNTQQYWVLMINPSDTTNTYVVIDASIDEAPIPKTITIQSPTTNDVFNNGYNYIDWSTTGDISYVRIELWEYNNGYWSFEIITPSTYNDGSYEWYLSSNDIFDGDFYLIKILDYNDNSIYANSDYFTIEIDEDYIDPYDTSEPINLGWLVYIILPVIAGAVIVAVLVRKRRKRIPREVIIQEKIIPIKIYCRECGTEIADKTKMFCSKCGTKIIN